MVSITIPEPVQKDLDRKFESDLSRCFWNYVLPAIENDWGKNIFTAIYDDDLGGIKKLELGQWRLYGISLSDDSFIVGNVCHGPTWQRDEAAQNEIICYAAANKAFQILWDAGYV